MAEEMQKTLAQEIAETLGEKGKLVLKQIDVIIEKFGVDSAVAMLRETLDIEANGGMMISEGTRRRTLGGIFFHLARERADPTERYQLSQSYILKNMRQTGEWTPDVPRRYKLRIKGYLELVKNPGEVKGVKIILTGRPGRLQTYKDLIVTTMQGTGIPNQFPKGVPQPPSTPTNYVIYISAKQWKKVAEAMQNPEDSLIIEGYCNLDPDTKAIAVYATALTTRLIRGALKEKQKADTTTKTVTDGEDSAEGNGATPAPKKPAVPPKAHAAPAKPAPPPQKVAAPAPAKPTVAAPPTPSISREEATAKLKALYQQEDEAREAMEEIKSLPPSEQTGLGDALRELQRIKNDIRAIKQIYPGL
jgi:hypothetical protein